MVLIRTPPNQRIYPLWNTQGLADALAKATGATNFGTYLGHSPTPERAIDAFSQIPMPRTNRVLGDAMADFVLNGKMPNGVSVWKWFGVRYIIWRQRINWNDGRGWIAMENRGSDTANHLDHDHISTNVIPIPSRVASQPTIPILGGEDMLIVNVKNTGIFLLRGSEVTHLGHPDHVLALVKVGVPYQDKAELDANLFKSLTGWGQARGLVGGSGLEEGADPQADQEAVAQYEELKGGVQEGISAIYDEYVKELQVSE